MEIQIFTSDPDNVNPEEIARTLLHAGWFVGSVDVNDGERVWRYEQQLSTN